MLSAIAHPQVAYLLLTLGMLGLTVEFWNPGAIFPGVAGGICLLLAFFALQVLPVSYAGVMLIVLGIVLLILEVKVTSFGVLAVGGMVSLFFGSLMLIDSPLPEMQIGLRMIVPITAVARRHPPVPRPAGGQGAAAADRHRRGGHDRRGRPGPDARSARRHRAGADPRRDLDGNRRQEPIAAGDRGPGRRGQRVATYGPAAYEGR